jgi:glycine oxidase
MASPCTIVVAGAGAIGRTVAYVLARAGHAVTVVDPDPAGGNASRIAAGMLAPAFEALFDGGRFEPLHEALELWRPIAHEIGLPIGGEGAMAVGTKAQARAWLRELLDLGVDADLRDLGGDHWAAYSDEDRQIDPQLALQRLRSSAERRGACYLTGRVLGFARGVVQIEDGAPIAADKLVIATGADQGLLELAPELAVLAPIKGHLLRTPGAFTGMPTVRAPGVYLCRTEWGTILGATMEPGRLDDEVEPAIARQLLQDAAVLSDGLGRLQWTAAAGVRAATPDGLPMVGEGAAPDVILAVGARRNGWLLAPMIAGVVLEAVEGRPSGRLAQLFDPARFS